jgi:ribonuclease P protein component
MPKKQRLSHKELIEQKPTKRLHGQFFSLSVAPLPSGTPKLTCVVSKKVALRAHDRNLLKRRCREVARPHLARIHSPLALVLYAKKAAAEQSFAAIRTDINQLLQSCQ